MALPTPGSGKSWTLTRSGSPAGCHSRPPLAVLADQLLLLRIHRDDRLPGGDVASAGRVDVAELGVAIGMLLAFESLGGGLQAVAQMMEHLPDDVIARGQPPLLQGLGQLAGTLAGPSQGGHRIAAGLGGDQLLQGLEQLRRGVTELLAAAPGTADSVGVRTRGIQLLQRPLDRDTRKAGGPADAADPAVAEGSGLGGSKEATLPLVEAGEERDEFAFQIPDRCP